ncbi:hypothetical protein BY458DRAFT_544870 [Sporodiniella umbellata]|nr:hypothetical protein BY458DRAFT_544870 [Sporodiniella umbellata]
MENRNEERTLQPLTLQSHTQNASLHESSVRSTNKVTDYPWPATSSSSFSFPSINSTSDTTKKHSRYDWRAHSLTICRHIITRGLEEGIGSDITIHAFGRPYRLHRLILDQNPYFKLLLAGGFRESESKQVTLHLEEHPFINIESFQFVLEYLYGKIEEPSMTSENVRQILATCSYFQLEDVSGLCMEFILKDITTKNVLDYLIFAEEHIVKGADQIFDAIFTLLCREAYDMFSGQERSLLLQLPLDWFEKVVSSDAFWVPSEYERYQFVLQTFQAQYELPCDHLNSYLRILNNSIYYMYMTFEQLQSIEKDIYAVTRERIVPDSILRHALWNQVLLRSKIESANEKDSKINATTRSQNKSTLAVNSEEEPYYYAIPTDDTTTYTGESAISLASRNIQQTNTKTEEYSLYPPFRFSVEFTDVASLKHNIRVYSDPVFYAGSNWNMYIQKTRSQRKGMLQLGVYLHRQSVPQLEDTPTTRSFSCYSDERKVVNTWFKIFCPSKGPKHSLTLFQSSPDNFAILQSWGWRSTTLCAEENSHCHSLDIIDPSVTSKTFVPSPSPSIRHINTIEIKSPNPTEKTNSGQTSLKFTVVMGHV